MATIYMRMIPTGRVSYTVDAYHAGNVCVPCHEPTELLMELISHQFTRFLVSNILFNRSQYNNSIDIFWLQNHSCEPNCMITSCYINNGDMEKPLLMVFTQEDVRAWGELCFSYSGPVSEKDVEVHVRLPIDYTYIH